MLLHQTQPSPSEWVGHYYRFTNDGLELGMDYQTEPTGALKGSNLSIPQLVEALNIYADFLEANPFNQK